MYAHSRKGTRVEQWHCLDDHAEGTARLAKRFATALKVPDLGEAIGLCHDAGKAYCSWQQRLLAAGANGRRIGIPHADVGAHLIHRVAGPGALAVLGHHKGLTEVGELDDIPTTQDQADRIDDAVQAFLTAVPRAAAVAAGPCLIPASWEADASLMDVGMRLLYSALVDADYLDTSAYKTSSDVHVGDDLDAANLLDRFDQVRLSAEHPSSDLNRLRGEIYDEAVTTAVTLPSGMYRLTTPTGTGKTLTSTGFALHHALHHGHRRVIMAVPFITITRQNASVLRTYLGEDSILEQHSGVDLPDDSWMKLATENWDAPFVITTTVQLFQSLFARNPFRMRKLHRIARSVIVLDEVQALPASMLVPILKVLRVLVEHFDCTVVLCSATQPTFDKLPAWRDLKVREIVQEPKRVFTRARTVRYRYWTDPKPTWQHVAEDAAGHDQSLLIVNTRRDAHALYAACCDAADGHTVLHISRDMCEQHILDTFSTATELLGTGHKLLLISTQLIEAGVDIDFPTVYRAWATAEAHIQSAGRCDRNGTCGNGLVVIFDPATGYQPRDYYATASSAARRYFGPTRALPDNLDALTAYFRDIYRKFGLDSLRPPRNKTMWEHWHHITHNRERLNFRDVAEGPHAFRMIDEDTVPAVITTYTPRHETPPDIVGVLSQLRKAVTIKPADIRRALRTIQPYLVSIRKNTAERSDVKSSLDPVIGDRLYEWRGQYSQKGGIVIGASTVEKSL